MTTASTLVSTMLLIYRRPPARCAAPVLALLAGLLATSALGADKKAAPPAPKTAILTPAQLRDCLARKEKEDKDTEAALKAKAEIDADQAEIDRSGAALEEQSTTPDRTSEEAIATYSAKVSERNNRIDARQAKITAYNTVAEKLLAAREARQKVCANRRYDERDLSDLQRKK